MKFLKILPIFFIATAFVFVAEAATFERNLRVGDRGEDVLYLQQILNQSEDTRLAISGPGSPGFETNYFGPITKSSVVLFQEKFREEVLAPTGLFKGTGFVGPLTRKKLEDFTNTLTTNFTSSVNPVNVPPFGENLPDSVSVDYLTGSPTNVSQNTSSDINVKYDNITSAPVITSIEPNIVDNPNEKLVIKGSNFLRDKNDVLFDTELETDYVGIKSLDSETLEVTFNFSVIKAIKKQLDQVYDVSAGELYKTIAETIEGVEKKDGKYLFPVNVFVKNKNGMSNTVQIFIDTESLLNNL